MDRNRRDEKGHVGGASKVLMEGENIMRGDDGWGDVSREERKKGIALTILEGLLADVHVELGGIEHGAEEHKPTDKVLEDGHAVVVGHVFDELDLLLEGPVVGALEIPAIVRGGQRVAVLDKAVVDACGMAHEGIAVESAGAVQAGDDVALNDDNGSAIADIVGKHFAAVEVLIGEGSVVVDVGNGEGTAEDERGAAVVDEGHAPETLADVCLFAGEAGLLGGIVVEAELDAETDGVADKTPEGAAVALNEVSGGKARGESLPLCRDTSGGG